MLQAATTFALALTTGPFPSSTSVLSLHRSPRMCAGPQPPDSNLNVIARLGEGAHGEVLLGESMDGHGLVAIKVGLKRGCIDREAAVLTAMDGVAGFPKVLHTRSGGDQHSGVLVMELLGPSIQDLWHRTLMRQHVSASTVLRVGRGALRCLRQLHLAGYVHNDIKPCVSASRSATSPLLHYCLAPLRAHPKVAWIEPVLRSANLVLGVSAGSSTRESLSKPPGPSPRYAREIHLIDFGLTTRIGTGFEPSEGAAIPEAYEPTGTPSFSSLAAHHRQRPMVPADDIEALVYTLAYLAVGTLPWTGEPFVDAARMKHQMLTDGCELLTDTCPIAEIVGDGHCPDVGHALEGLWAEVTRCQGRGHGHGRHALVDYDACLAALSCGCGAQEAAEEAFELSMPSELDAAREAGGTLLPEGYYRP